MSSWIVVLVDVAGGGLLNGAVGPFETEHDARDYADERKGMEFIYRAEVVELVAPTERKPRR